MVAFNNHIKKTIEKITEHNFIGDHMSKPIVDSEKICILRYIFDEANINEQKIHDFTIAVMLVQIALDTHELVPLNSTTKKAIMKRQLTVLAGDYYSGLYYALLAKIGEVDFIRTLASAIKTINESKMTLYHENIHTWSELMINIKKIESLLFTTVANSLALPADQLKFIEEVLLINRLSDEIEKIEQNEFSYITYYIEQELVTCEEQTVVLQIEKELENSKEAILLNKQSIPYYLMNTNNFIFGKNNLSAVEEG